MKKLTTISLIIFAILTSAILTAGLVFYQNNKNGQPELNNSGLNNSAASSSASSSAGSGATPAVTLNLAEVAKHSSLKDCWVIISNKVYNVSGYLSAHPGAAASIIPYCGKEASKAYATKDKNTPHSDYAVSLLANYYVGNYNQKINQAPAVNADSNALNSAASAGSLTKPAVNPPPAAAPAKNINLSAQEIAKHNSTGDCWLIISDKIYNVTNYLSAHPGGVSTIAPYCGREATQAFAAKGGSGSHSSYAHNLLANYYIGALNQIVGQQQIQQNINNANSVQSPAENYESESENENEVENDN